MKKLELFLTTNTLIECLEVWIPTNISPDQLEIELHRATVLRTALDDLISGKMSLLEYLEFVEFLNIDIDSYLDEVEQNLNSTELIHLR